MNYKLIKLIVFIYLSTFYPNTIIAQDDSQETDYDRRLQIAEDFLKRNSSKQSEPDSIKTNKENKN